MRTVLLDILRTQEISSPPTPGGKPVAILVSALMSLIEGHSTQLMTRAGLSKAPSACAARIMPYSTLECLGILRTKITISDCPIR